MFSLLQNTVPIAVALIYLHGDEDRGPKGWERGWSSWVGGSEPPPHHQLGVWGSAVSCPSGVQGEAPAANGFYRIWILKTASPDTSVMLIILKEHSLHHSWAI